MTKKVYGVTDTKQLLAAAKAIQADVVALGLDKPSEPDPERLQLLEAVAEAMKGILAAYEAECNSDYYQDGEQLGEAMDSGAHALAALETLGEKEQP